MPIQIKKYGNRRLYNTETSRYVNLDELAALVRSGQTIEVSDVATGQDLTRSVLLQIILEHSGGEALFPAGLLHRVVRASGEHPAQKMLMTQLAQAMSLMDTQFAALESQFPWLKMGAPWTGVAPAAPGPTGQAAPPEPPPEEAPAQAAPPPGGAAPSDEDSLDALRARLAALEGRLKKG